ncbi:hypothetical protein R1sor_019286 [Riccia sorocarpa]|uniref:Mitochondrial carrier protein n=1 Tax=Riccia sorocarpa TaxID=122646 RepID=A0ABD3IFE3_9MARC
MAGTRGTAETLTSRAASASASQMQRQRMVAERVAALPPLVCKPSDRTLDFSGRHADAGPVGEFELRTLFPQVEAQVTEDNIKELKVAEKTKKVIIKPVRVKVKNHNLKRLLCGAVAGAFSRTCVAPLETIRTHLMVGSGGHTLPAVFNHIVSEEGWRGLFRGNGVNVLRVAPSKAIELFAYDTVKKFLISKEGEKPRIPFPIAPVAGATAGVCSTLVMYPLELLKTRLTIQRGVYDNLLHAMVKICKEEGPKELYRGLTPSLIGVMPYAATNYFAYDTLRKFYRKYTKQERVGNVATLCIGSTSAAISSAFTFPLEVARKQMQLGAVSGRVVYRDLFHALTSILEQQGTAGLYRGLAASCFKLIPAAGISFMCYEGMKQILIDDEEEQRR